MERTKVGGVGGCAKLDFFRQILCIYNHLGCEETLALQSPKTKQIHQQIYENVLHNKVPKLVQYL